MEACSKKPLTKLSRARLLHVASLHEALESYFQILPPLRFVLSFAKIIANLWSLQCGVYRRCKYTISQGAS